MMPAFQSQLSGVSEKSQLRRPVRQYPSQTLHYQRHPTKGLLKHSLRRTRSSPATTLRLRHWGYQRLKPFKIIDPSQQLGNYYPAGKRTTTRLRRHCSRFKFNPALSRWKRRLQQWRCSQRYLDSKLTAAKGKNRTLVHVNTNGSCRR